MSDLSSAEKKKTFGFHPLTAFGDHGTGASGEPLAILLRASNAGANTAAEHIQVTRLALAQIPSHQRRRVLIRTDSGGGTHEFLNWLASPGRRLHYSIGMTIAENMQDAILALRDRVWERAYDADGQLRPGARLAELTGLLDLAGWPKGMRVIVRKERPYPGAQLRFTDLSDYRFTAFATDAWRGQTLGLSHRRRARSEDRIRCAKDTGLRNLPLHGFDQNQIWCELVAIACELLAWMQMLALDGPARVWEPKRLRLRLFSAAGRLAAAAAACGCASPPPGHGPASSRPRSPPAGPRSWLTRPSRPYDQEGQTQGPWTPPRRDSREARHGHTLKTATSPSRTRTCKDRETSRLIIRIGVRGLIGQDIADQ